MNAGLVNIEGRQVGIIGLGLMVAPLRKATAGRGVEIICHDVSVAAMDRMAEEGVSPAESPAAVAAKASFVMRMLREAEDVRRVLVGAEGAVEGGT